MRMLDSFIGMIELFSEVVAERVGRAPDDFDVRTAVGAVVGVGIAVWLSSGGPIGRQYASLYARALDLLEAGLPL